MKRAEENSKRKLPRYPYEDDPIERGGGPGRRKGEGHRGKNNFVRGKLENLFGDKTISAEKGLGRFRQRHREGTAVENKKQKKKTPKRFFGRGTECTGDVNFRSYGSHCWRGLGGSLQTVKRGKTRVGPITLWGKKRGFDHFLGKSSMYRPRVTCTG